MIFALSVAATQRADYLRWPSAFLEAMVRRKAMQAF
jgi:hypothetical protein